MEQNNCRGQIVKGHTNHHLIRPACFSQYRNDKISINSSQKYNSSFLFSTFQFNEIQNRNLLQCDTFSFLISHQLQCQVKSKLVQARSQSNLAQSVLGDSIAGTLYDLSTSCAIVYPLVHFYYTVYIGNCVLHRLVWVKWRTMECSPADSLIQTQCRPSELCTIEQTMFLTKLLHFSCLTWHNRFQVCFLNDFLDLNNNRLDGPLRNYQFIKLYFSSIHFMHTLMFLLDYFLLSTVASTWYIPPGGHTLVPPPAHQFPNALNLSNAHCDRLSLRQARASPYPHPYQRRSPPHGELTTFYMYVIKYI